MKIAIDLQGVQSEGSRTRGIGRYSLEIIRYMIKNFPENHYFLVANAALSDLNIELEDELRLSNVTYFKWYSPGPIDFISKEIKKTKLGIYLRSYSFSCLNADIILITSFLEGFSDNCLVDLDKDFIDIPIVSIFYDLIPLINSNLYLNNNPEFSRYYRSKLKKLKDLDGLLGISLSSSQEAIKYLDYDKDKIFNISSACNKKIFNTNSKIDFSLSEVISSFTPFILYSGASDPRKNIKRLLEAYSLLPKELKKYKLVLVGKLLPPEKELINQWITDFNINSENIYKTGYISDSDLVCLYRRCSLFVFPSLHEGFGLPILEAMSCGAPVIGSNSTSIPEIIGLKQAMFNPYNVCEIADLITKSLTNEQFYNELKSNSFSQSNKFSWSKTADLAIKALDYFVNKSPNKNYSDSFNSLLDNNKIKFNLLLNKLRSCRSRFFQYDKELDSQIAASIDKINTQIQGLNRHLFFKDKILNWRVEGPFDSSYSLSILNKFFVESLYKKIPNVSIHITEGLGDYSPNIEYLKQSPKLFSIFEDSSNKATNYDVLSRNLYPPRVKDMKAKYNILHSYGWEESGLPFEWVMDFNSHLQGITVMSYQVKKILIDNGVAVPIKVSGLGVDHINQIEPDTDYKVKAKRYKFLHISSCFPRKGIDILLKSYTHSFNINDDVSLIIKTFDNIHNDVELTISKLQKANPEIPNIVLIKDDLSLPEIKSLYLQSDVLVAPSRGEGFGLPIAEAMLIGLPVITTNWGGQIDFCNDKNSWLIDYDFAFSNSHFNLQNSFWAEPSTLHLSQLLIEVYQSKKSEIIKKTSLAQDHIKSYHWDNVVDKNIHALDNYFCKFDNKISKIGWVSTWNSKCGIASYSRRFINYMPDDICVFTPHNENTCVYDENTNLIKEDQVLPCWNYPYNKDSNLDELYLQIRSNNISSLVVQFNFNFFDINQLILLFEKLIKSKIIIILVLHSTIFPKEYDANYVCLFKKLLLKCNRVIVHTLNDINRLKNLGFIDNITLLNHPIIDNKNNMSDLPSNQSKYSKKETLNIVSYGFCLPMKGFSELIRSIHILKNKQFSITLDIYSAIYNQDYYFLFKELLDLVKELNLHDFVRLHPEFIPENKLLTILSQYDLLVFPYQKSNESSSASVRDGLATLRPVIVTPLSIFDDVADLTDRFRGTSPDHLAQGLLEWHSKNIVNPQLSEISYKDRITKIKERGFSKVSQRLSLMIKSLEINE